MERTSEKVFDFLNKRNVGSVRQRFQTISPGSKDSIYNQTNVPAFQPLIIGGDSIPLKQRAGLWDEEVVQGFGETHFVNE